jgi:exodeoxyribonuclease-3
MGKIPKTLLSWNVNGLRAIFNKNALNSAFELNPQVLCLQETKAHPEQLPEALLNYGAYHSYFMSGVRKGYSGVATYSKIEPDQIETMGNDEFDREGRVQILTFNSLALFNCYFPNSQEEGKRLSYKLAFCAAVLKKANRLRDQGKDVVICGDYNIAHKEIDLKNPQSNQNNPGFLPEERAWMDQFIAAGYTDCFRQFNQNQGQYTWWSYRLRARARNIGWRIDYHCVNRELKERVQKAEIYPHILGSDHCPVFLQLKQ